MLQLDRSSMLNRLPLSFILLLLSFILFTGCPEHEEPLECGPNQIEVNGECECEEGYHWNAQHSNCVLDTTSHDFIWTEISTGTGGLFNGVAILNDSTIWAVGKVETDTEYYNFAKWDGRWIFEDIDIGQQLYDILVFEENDIWVVSGRVHHWDGISWENYDLWDSDVLQSGIDGILTRIWGLSSNNIYFAGLNGTVVHYNGSEFINIRTGVNRLIRTISGYCTEDKTVIYAGFWTDAPNRGMLMQYDGSWEIIWDENNPFFDNPVYITPTFEVIGDSIIMFTGGSTNSIITHHSVVSIDEYRHTFLDENGFVRNIYGNSINDYFLVGDFGNVLHYNGKSYHKYEELSDSHQQYIDVDQKSNMVAIIGIGTRIFIGNR